MLSSPILIVNSIFTEKYLTWDALRLKRKKAVTAAIINNTFVGWLLSKEFTHVVTVPWKPLSPSPTLNTNETAVNTMKNYHNKPTKR